MRRRSDLWQDMGMTDIDAEGLAADLTEHGYAVRPLLDPATCRSLERLYDQDSPFRKRIVMEQRFSMRMDRISAECRPACG